MTLTQIMEWYWRSASQVNTVLLILLLMLNAGLMLFLSYMLRELQIDLIAKSQKIQILENEAGREAGETQAQIRHLQEERAHDREATR